MAEINHLKPPNSTPSYHPILQESTRLLLTQLNSGFSDFSHFSLLFSRLIQTMPSPPIEIIWFYTAVNYQTHKNMSKAQDQNYGHILCLEELFNSLVSSSGSCSSCVNRVAVLAPLIYELHNLIELKMVDNVVIKEIKCLVDRLVSYTSLCCFEAMDYHDESPAFSPCFVDLIKVWTFGTKEKSCEFEDDFRIFFPLVSDKGRHELLLRGEVGVLAGFVMCQVFLLNLCLKSIMKERPQNVEDVVMVSAVNTITGFRSCYFFVSNMMCNLCDVPLVDALLKMLLESSLPITSLLTTADGVMLQEAIYGAIVLVDYPFFNPASGICLCNHHLNSLASTWLFVADRAMQFVRNHELENKVILYMKAFTKSLVGSQLMRWVAAQIGMVEDTNIPKFSTPAAFLEWLVQLRGVDSLTFDNDFSLFLDKAMCYNSEMTFNLPFSEANRNKSFCIDEKAGFGDGIHGDLEMSDPFKLDFSGSETFRKRKGEKHEDDVQAKLVKYHMEGSPPLNFSPFQAQVGLARRS
ncbi:hypothetical protein KSS87_002579 [Heliosperma pusillum]|nr:hypothetical protein KSS87_002579 [Heliosperma pusillum]